MKRLVFVLLALSFTGCNQYRKLIGMDCKNDDGAYQAPGTPVPSVPPVPVIPPPSGPTHAYLMMGQSNMSRNCSDDVPRFLSNDNATHDAGCSTGEAIGRILIEPDALFVQCAYGGTEMSRWMPGGDLYEGCLKLLPTGLPVKAMFFFQGEADAINGLSVPDWSDAFTSMVQNLRSRVNNPTLPVVFGQIGSGRNDPAWIALQNEQASVSLPHCSMVTTSDLPPYDGVHFSQGSYSIISQRMVGAL